MHPDNQQLIQTLKQTSVLLDLDKKSQLNRDINSICNYLTNPNFRIAVFGPFNAGKSTLLNAILGNRTLPIDLIPTTGAAITVKYGTEIRTRIILSDGSEIYRSGTEILKQYAILDGSRRMRNDVLSVEVYCPHSFLDKGVELIDLPGTNDREEQDKLVQEQLLSADLVIQLLDARKLMTLGERENLREWLLERGIKTVIFVANFLNLLEPSEQKEVQNRLRFVGESFRAEIPPGFSNLYRVDALPALRARLKGDVAAANTSGLTAFETALQNLVTVLKQNRGSACKPRVEAIALQLSAIARDKIEPLKNAVSAYSEKEAAKSDIKNRAFELIKKGFSIEISRLREWLAHPNLLSKYQSNAAIALARNNFTDWQINTLKKDFNDLQQPITKWLNQAYDFFQTQPAESLNIPFPPEPLVALPTKLNNGSGGSLDEAGSFAVGGGIGWLLGGPLGAAVVGSITYLVNKNLQKQEDSSANQSYEQEVAKLCLNAVEEYFRKFSKQALEILDEYEKKAERVINFQPPAEPLSITQKYQELQQLQQTVNKLSLVLEQTLGITIPREIEIQRPEQTPQTSQSSYRFSQTQVKEDVRPKQPVKNNPPSQQAKVENLEAKFRNWEIDQEIAQMKQQMNSPGSQSDRNTAPKQPAKQVDKNKVQNAYAILGLQNTASMAEVKQAYRTLVKKWHPDLFVDNPQMQKQAHEKMRQINDAYTLLSD